MNITQLSKITAVNNVYNNFAPKQAFRFGLYAQKPDTFERTYPVNFTGKSNRIKQYNKVIESLELTHKNAQTSLNGQIAKDGWAGKTADFVSGLWNSKNRAHLVQADLDSYKNQIGELKDSIPQDKFNQKFEDIFGVEYKPAKIVKFNKKVNEFNTAVTTKCMADITERKLSKDLDLYKKNNGVLQDLVEKKLVPVPAGGGVVSYNEVTPKEKVYGSLEKALVEVVGSKELLNQVMKTNGVDTDKASDETKYKAYGLVAEYLVETSKATAKKASKGKSLEDIKSEYDKAYSEAYGTKNDIQKRVDKYNRSQEIGAAAVRGVTRSAISIAVLASLPTSGLGSILASAGTTFGAKVLVDGSDKATNAIDNSIDLDSKALSKLIKSSAISAAENFATKGLNKIVPLIDTGSEILDTALEQVAGTAIDTSCGMISERLKQGAWNKDQIVPRLIISTVFRNLGADNEVTKDLLKMTKGGVNQAMKKKTRDYETVQQFIEGTRTALDAKYLEDNKVFGELKEFAGKNKKEYEKMMVDLLQQVVDENAENQKTK